MNARAAADDPLVSVVTLTRGRGALLERAIASVEAQRGVRVEHVVLGDACPQLADPGLRARLTAERPHLALHNVPREQPVDYLPARLGALRNHGVQLARGEYVAQLDDDNAFEPDHLRLLVEALRRTPRAEAAHSWRCLFDAHDSPFVPTRVDPWRPASDADGRSFATLTRLGILSPGSNVVRDRLDTGGELLPRVDTSEYLVTRTLHERCPWQTCFSRGARRLGFTEDVSFSAALVRLGVVVACSEQPTLRYYMGGYSNDRAADTPDTPRVAG
ncbi:MAG TPA: glycosyltransferase family A protein [Conexibacter sp.]|nr:glycosyltransferase family A protein [Conexibacter sp.]